MGLRFIKIVVILSVISPFTAKLFAQTSSNIDHAAINELIAFSDSTYADEIMLIHQNETVMHWKNPSCEAPQYNTASMVKSWTGLVIGALIHKKIISSENDSVCSYLPDWEIGCSNAITIKQLLTMSAGYNRRSGARGILAEKDMNDYVLHTEPDTLPDIRFAYSNESVQLLGLMIEEVTGMTANEAFTTYLFEPLGMDSTKLGTDEMGNHIVFGGATTTVQDASNIGKLMLNQGTFNGKQIVSKKWIEQSLTPSDKAGYYGYLWWLDYGSEHKNFAAMGDFGQLTIVFPDLELVFLRQQSCNKDISGNMPWMGPDFLKLISNVIRK